MARVNPPTKGSHHYVSRGNTNLLLREAQPVSPQEAHIYFHEKHNQWFRQKHSLCFHEKHNCATTVLLEREKHNLCLYEKHSDSARSTTCLSLKKHNMCFQKKLKTTTVLSGSLLFFWFSWYSFFTRFLFLELFGIRFFLF